LRRYGISVIIKICGGILGAENPKLPHVFLEHDTIDGKINREYALIR